MWRESAVSPQSEVDLFFSIFQYIVSFQTNALATGQNLGKSAEAYCALRQPNPVSYIQRVFQIKQVEFCQKYEVGTLTARSLETGDRPSDLIPYFSVSYNIGELDISGAEQSPIGRLGETSVMLSYLQQHRQSLHNLLQNNLLQGWQQCPACPPAHGIARYGWLYTKLSVLASQEKVRSFYTAKPQVSILCRLPGFAVKHH